MENGDDQVTVHRPADFIGPEFYTRALAVLVILNTPIPDSDQKHEAFRRIWGNTKPRICADGGANRLYDLFKPPGKSNMEAQGKDSRESYIPDAIIGDLDSIRPEVRNYYNMRGTKIIQDNDQDTTDFNKAIHHMFSGLLPRESRLDKGLPPSPRSDEVYIDVVILGSLTGRVDQALGLFHEMYREAKGIDRLRLWLFLDKSCSFLLRPGKHRIYPETDVKIENLPEKAQVKAHTRVQKFTGKCGILPLYGPSRISTKGLQWDVQNWETQMGGRVSTSNQIMNLKHGVEIVTTHTVLFTIERNFPQQMPSTAGSLDLESGMPISFR